MLNTDPWPTSESTCRLYPMSWHIDREIVSLRPVPPNRRVVLPSAC